MFPILCNVKKTKKKKRKWNKTLTKLKMERRLQEALGFVKKSIEYKLR